MAFPDGGVLYVDIQRDNNGATLDATIADGATLGQPAVPGSRQVLAWRKGDFVYAKDRNFEVGRATPVATTTTDGIVRLYSTPGNAGHPLVPTFDSNNALTISGTTTSGAKLHIVSGASQSAELHSSSTSGTLKVTNTAVGAVAIDVDNCIITNLGDPSGSLDAVNYETLIRANQAIQTSNILDWNEGATTTNPFCACATNFSSSISTAPQIALIYGGAAGALYTAYTGGGTSWTSRTSQFSSDDIYSIASNGSNMIVAVGGSGKISSSPDGVTWTARTSGLPSDDLEGVIYASSLSVPVWIVSDADDNTALATSLNGTSWSPHVVSLSITDPTFLCERKWCSNFI